MTVRPGRLVMLCGMLPTIAVALLSLYRPAFLRNWEFGAYDTVLRATPTRQPAGRIVIVDIDDRSLTTIGQWPWRRDVIGRFQAGTAGLDAHHNTARLPSCYTAVAGQFPSFHSLYLSNLH